MIKPIRRKEGTKKELPSVGGMPINLDFEKQNKIVKRAPMQVGELPTMEEINNIRMNWEETKTSFIFNGCLYELHSSRNDSKWKGICYYPLSAPVLIPKEKCVLISKQEPILKVFYMVAKRLSIVKEEDSKGFCEKSLIVSEQLFILDYTLKTIIQSFSE